MVYLFLSHEFNHRIILSYYINENEAKVIEFKAGKTYRFNQNDASNTAAAIIFSAATPPVTPVASPEGVKVMPVIKRDLVVRFREQQNSVKCEMAATKRGTEGNHHSHSGEGGMDNNGSSVTTTTTNIKYKEQYEVQHYSSHPHGPMSPCDSENSVCNRSRENLIGKPPKKLHMYILPILLIY